MLISFYLNCSFSHYKQAGATPMLDNDPRDKYLYEIMVFTGARKGAGRCKYMMDSDLFCNII